jgi:hypothetical protein
MKKLPLAITTFADIRDKAENYLYVDKTDMAWQLVERGKYYFLSRPRRFGKSLFIDTLSDLFEAKKYYQKYLNEAKISGQDIYLVGICFASEERNITEFEWEKLKSYVM